MAGVDILKLQQMRIFWDAIPFAGAHYQNLIAIRTQRINDMFYHGSFIAEDDPFFGQPHPGALPARKHSARKIFSEASHHVWNVLLNRQHIHFLPLFTLTLVNGLLHAEG